MDGMAQQINLPTNKGRWLPPGLHLRDWRQAATAPIFDGLPAEAMMKALRSGHLLCFDKGQEVFSPDCRPQAFLLVLQGRIKLYFLDRNGEERGLRFAGPGELLCPHMDEGHTASGCCTFAEATESLRLLVLPAAFFLQQLRNHFPLVRNLIAQLAASLERAGQQASLRKARSAPALVARYLLERMQDHHASIELRPVRTTAQELGIARETLSRVISKMRQHRLIDYDRGKVLILDQPGLLELASQ